MKKSVAATILLLSLVAVLLPFNPWAASAEEVSVTDASALFLSGAYENRNVIPQQVKFADVAGVGRFLNVPSPEAPTVRIALRA